MARLEIPIKVDIYKIEELIDQLKHLQTYKLDAGDEMTLVDRDDVVEIIADHVKAEVSPPDQRWIPCSETEEAPEYEVIACNADGEEMLGYLSTDGVDWECDSAYELMTDVVAWMKKPKPWEGEKP